MVEKLAQFTGTNEYEKRPIEETDKYENRPINMKRGL